VTAFRADVQKGRGVLLVPNQVPRGGGSVVFDHRVQSSRDEFDSEQAKWTVRLVIAGSFLTLVFQMVYLVLDRAFLSLDHPWVLIFHLLNISLYGMAVLLSVFRHPWIQSHWKAFAFSFSTLMIWSSAAIAIFTRQTEPLFLTIVLFLAGTGTFLSWGARNQLMLSIVAIGAFSCAELAVPERDPYQWLAILIATAIGGSSAGLLKGLQRARRKAQQELLESRQTLAEQEGMRLAGQLAAGIAHDLNNNLNILKLRLSALQLDQRNTSDQLEHLAVIERAIEDATRTVARVRELDRTRESPATEPAKLDEVVEQAIDLVRSTIEGRPISNKPNIQIISNVGRASSYVDLNPSELRQAFVNLLLNAADAITAEGRITIDASEEPGAVRVTVSDTGMGIPADHLPHIFQPFYTTKGTTGTGLGLSIVKEIIHQSGGRISAANRPQGGAVFSLVLPLTQRLPSRPSPVLTRSSTICRFMLIDDDPANLDALAEVLTILGHRTEIAVSGPQALGKLRADCAFDIVLCDLSMPGMNGWEVATEALRLAPHLSFYIVTGWGKQFEQHAPAGTSGIVSKPVDPLEIDRIVTEHLKKKQQRQSREIRASSAEL
jgi:signal transduction histidine kinase/ActR/RegA family two-component response regulator